MPPRAYKRTILITGATDGIGKQIANSLAANHRENFVIVHGRSPTKCSQTVATIMAENKLEMECNVEYIAADFSTVKEVVRMAEELKIRFPRLNTFIACASVLINRRSTSADGLELGFQINHLSHFYLWNAMLPLLEANAPSRIITVGSSLHAMGSIDYDDLMAEKLYDKYLQYSRTKLMNHMTTMAIHRLLYTHGVHFSVTANVIDAEEPAENHHDVTCLSASRSYLCSRGNGVHTIQRLVEAPELAHVSGKYFDSMGKEIRSTTVAVDERAQQRLWETDEKLCASLDVPSPRPSPPTVDLMHLGSLEAARKHLLENNNVADKFVLPAV
uniref:NAD(P)-binding protein n=1 Tax=Panagrellus redivivus TaxID=6233 RepID=A0A7E4UZJ5_PANRE